MASTYSYASAFGTKNSLYFDSDLSEVAGKAAFGAIFGIVVHLWDIYASNFLKIPALCLIALCWPPRFGRFGKFAAAGPPLAWLARRYIPLTWGVTTIHVLAMAILLVIFGIVDSHDYTVDPSERKGARIHVLLFSYLVATLFLAQEATGCVWTSFEMLWRGSHWQKVCHIVPWFIASLLMFLLHMSGSLGDNLEVWILWSRRCTYDRVRRGTTAVERWCISATSMPSYEYRPLGHAREIRLLKLERKGLISSILRASIIHVDVDEAPQYEAISYTWARTTQDQELLIDGSKLLVNLDLLNLLAGRASRTEERLIWIDYICIDQSNSAEKSHQIPMMRDIYQRASQTAIWLEDLYDSALAAKSLEHLVAVFESDRYDIVELADHFYRQHDRPRWKALQRILQHRYFSRAWICQEMAVSRRPLLYLGGRAFAWESITQTIEKSSDPQFVSIVMMALSKNWDPESFENVKVLSLLRAATSQNVRMPLGYILSHTFDFEATFGEDKILALLGVALQDSICASITKDIGKPAKEVFTAAAQSLLVSPQHSRYILPMAGIGYTRFPEAEDLPSWCPDWITGRTGARFSIEDLPGAPELSDNPGPPHSAAGSTVPRIIHGIQPGTLLLHGAEIDVISSVSITLLFGPGPEAGVSPDIAVDNSLQFVNLFLKNATVLANLCQMRRGRVPFAEGEDAVSTFWRTLIGNRAGGRCPAPAVWGVYYRIWAALTAAVASPDGTAKLSTAAGWLPLLGELRDRDPLERHGLRPDLRLLAVQREFMRCFSRAAAGKRFCVTAGGRMGMVPAGARKDDMVCLISGMQTPYLLRAVEEEEGDDVPERKYEAEPMHLWAGKRYEADGPVYQLVGECYIHGVMQGEAVGTGVETNFTIK